MVVIKSLPQKNRKVEIESEFKSVLKKSQVEYGKNTLGMGDLCNLNQVKIGRN